MRGKKDGRKEIFEETVNKNLSSLKKYNRL